MTPCTVAYQALPSMEFSRQEYWSGLPFPAPEDLPNQGFEPRSPALQAEALPSELLGKPYSLLYFQEYWSCKIFGSERSPREMLIPYLCFSFWHGGGTRADSCDSHRSRGRIHSSCHSYSLLLNNWQVTELYQKISRICGEPFLYTVCSTAFKLKEMYLWEE